MLKQLESLRPGVDTAVCYINDELLRYHLQGVFEKVYKVSKDYIVQVETAKQLEKAKSDAMLAPLTGSRWLLLVDLDKVPVTDFEKNIFRGNDNSFTFAFCKKYGNFKRTLDCRALKNGAGTERVYTAYLGNFRSEDIFYLYKKIVPQDNVLTEDVLNFLCKHYCWDVSKVMLLFAAMKQGTVINTREDLISFIGLGGVTVDSVVVDLLRIDPTTDKKRKNAIKKFLSLFKDLNNKYSYATIYTSIKQSLMDIITYKMLVLRGDITRILKIIPKGFELKRIQRLKRFEWVLRDSISLRRTLLLLSIFKRIDDLEAGLKTPIDDSPIPADTKLLLVLYDFVALWELKK